MLSGDDMHTITTDFVDWSGGHFPDECTIEQIDTYIQSTLDTKYDREEVRDFLINYGN